MSENSFEGFPPPTKNFFSLPNEMVNIIAHITNMAELKIILYVMRHTWGFHEYGITKSISTDEFMRGRRKQDGTRMDEGTGLSNRSVIDGIQAAIQHGYLICEIDTSDRARTIKSYALKMAPPYEESSQGTYEESSQGTYEESSQGTYEESSQGTYEESSQGTYEESSQGTYEESSHRSEKDTREKHLEKNTEERHDSRESALASHADLLASFNSLSHSNDKDKTTHEDTSHLPSDLPHHQSSGDSGILQSGGQEGTTAATTTEGVRNVAPTVPGDTTRVVAASGTPVEIATDATTNHSPGRAAVSAPTAAQSSVGMDRATEQDTHDAQEFGSGRVGTQAGVETSVEQRSGKRSRKKMLSPDDPLVMPPPDAKWCPETAVQIVEVKKGERYSEKTRAQELSAARAILAMRYKGQLLTRAQFEQAWDEMAAWDWWLTHKLQPLIKHLVKDDKIISILKGLEGTPSQNGKGRPPEPTDFTAKTLDVERNERNLARLLEQSRQKRAERGEPPIQAVAASSTGGST